MVNKKATYITSLLFFILSFIGLLWIFFPLLINPNLQFLSPIPSSFVLSKNFEVMSLDFWQPIVNAFGDNSNLAPDITAKSALSYDLTTQTALFEKNPTIRLPFASLTKIMTAIIALEHPKENDEYIVSSSDLVGEDSMGLTAGEVLSLKELLYGLILNSGNDAAETLASNFSQGRDEFIKAMNQKAQSLGLSDTHFTNPTGLEGDGDQYTTASDLLVISRYALQTFPLFAEVAATPFYTIEQTDTHKAFYLENETNLLTSYPGVKGIKTGYTPEANLCLVTYLEYKDHKILAVLLGSEDRRDEMKQILDYSLKKLGITPPPHG